MISTLGRFSLALALAIALYGVIVSILGARRRSPSLVASGRGVGGGLQFGDGADNLPGGAGDVTGMEEVAAVHGKSKG